jgi:hypothetical protein
VSQPSVSRYLSKFVQILCANAHDYINFPLDDDQWLEKSSAANFKSAKMPGVIASVDGFHVLIKKPERNSAIYLNRKSLPSINCQVLIYLMSNLVHVCYHN